VAAGAGRVHEAGTERLGRGIRAVEESPRRTCGSPAIGSPAATATQTRGFRSRALSTRRPGLPYTTTSVTAGGYAAWPQTAEP
jgi:hypothetical protein